VESGLNNSEDYGVMRMKEPSHKKM